jgi:hypothetical protein
VADPSQRYASTELGNTNELMRAVTKDFNFESLVNSENPNLRRLGTQMTLAFQDPIAAIKQEYGLDDDNLFKPEEEVVLAGPFSNTALFFSNMEQKEWVDTKIVGQLSLILLKDVGAPLTVIRIVQECPDTGLIGDLLFEYEVPLNCQMQKLTSKFTALAILNTKEFVGFASRSAADMVKFNMKLTELADTLNSDELTTEALH